MQPKVSVVIPIYNQEKYLRECLDSVVNQTLKDIEIICVNDGSTDGSLAILEEYAEKDNRIKIINQENQGAGVARNNGIDIATGEYLMFLDPDDWYDSNACEKAYTQIKQNNNDLVVFNFIEYIEKTGKSSKADWRLAPLKNHFNQPKINLRELKNYISCAYTVTQIYSLNFIKDNNILFSNNKFAEDVPFYIKAIVSAKDVSIINEPLYFYRIQEKSSSQTFYDNWNDLLDVRYKCLEFINNRSDGKYYIYPFLKYTIESLLFWYKKAESRKYKNIKDFYNSVRCFFRMIDKLYDIKKIKNDIKYRTFKKICSCSWEVYNLLKFGEVIFSVKKSPDRQHKIFTIFGIKIKIKNLKFIDVYNMGTHKVFKILFIKIKIKRYFLLNLTNYKINKNKIVFSNYLGKSYGCNSKYITEEILKRKLPYELVWLVNNPEKERENFPTEIRLEDFYSKRGLIELLTAKLWVDNTRKPYFWSKGLKKKSEQKYIQTWHGSLGMKKIEAAIKKESNYWRKNAKIDSKNIDYLLTTSETDKKFMRQSFWYDGEILVSGYPRNDVLYSDDQNKQLIKEKVYKFLGIDKDSKFILYVPTFRDDGRTTCFTLDYERILKTFEEKYSCKAVLGTRFHPRNFDFANKLIAYSESIVNATIYPDIMELLIAADVVITDYSSCIFDFMHLERPAFIFATDIEQYEKERGFYFPLEDTPFSIAQNNDELVENIHRFDASVYTNRIVEYMKKNGYADDGHASERIVDLIETIMNSKI